jgi:hypothetical protein
MNPAFSPKTPAEGKFGIKKAGIFWGKIKRPNRWAQNSERGAGNSECGCATADLAMGFTKMGKAPTWSTV